MMARAGCVDLGLDTVTCLSKGRKHFNVCEAKYGYSLAHKPNMFFA